MPPLLLIAVRLGISSNTLPKTNMTMENRHGLIGDKSSNGWFSIYPLILLGERFGARDDVVSY